MKEIGKELSLLLKNLNEKVENESSVVVVKDIHVANSSSDGRIIVELRNKRLGHVSSVVLKKVLARNLQSISQYISKCTIHPYAKQTRMQFPSSSIKSVECFDLVYLYLWGT